MRLISELLLLIEFLDELVFGAREAAWPLIRAELGLTYGQVGILLGLPRIVSGLIEPLLGVLGDVWRRRALVVGGGVVFALALALSSVSRSYGWLLLSFVLFYPASGAFVSLSQATLMDLAPRHRDRNMARWTLAGSLGVVAGPIALGAAAALSLGWRAVYAGAALATVLLVLAARGASGTATVHSGSEGEGTSLVEGLRGAWLALQRRSMLRWLTLLQFSDLMLDVLLGYLALYMVDVGQVTSSQAALAVAVWSGAGLVGDYLIIQLLRRVDGLAYLRVSAAIELILLSAFLLVSPYAVKVCLLGLLGLFNAGWYSILKAQLYTAMPGKSGTAMAVSNIFGLAGALIPLALGWVAQRAGLSVAMWLLLVGPVALLVGLPSRRAR